MEEPNILQRRRMVVVTFQLLVLTPPIAHDTPGKYARKGAVDPPGNALAFELEVPDRSGFLLGQFQRLAEYRDVRVHLVGDLFQPCAKTFVKHL